MKGRRGTMGIMWTAPKDDTWIDYDYYLHINRQPMVIEQGSRQRALPCLVCNAPCGSQQCYLLCLVAGILCPNDGSHLNAAGFFCHVRCMPRDKDAIIRAVVAGLADHGS